MGRDTREAEQGRGASEWRVPKRPLGARHHSGEEKEGRRSWEPPLIQVEK